MKKYLLGVAVLCALSANAIACNETPSSSAFGSKIDRNGDGEISRREWKKMRTGDEFNRDFKRGNKKVFKELDTNGDGKLSEEELQALQGKVSYRHDSECLPDDYLGDK